VFLALLDDVAAEGQNASHKIRAGNYAPILFMSRLPKDRADYQRTDFERAMQILLKARKIQIVPYGSPSDRLEKLIRVEASEAAS
jgi:hypothetical protein